MSKEFDEKAHIKQDTALSKEVSENKVLEPLQDSALPYLHNTAGKLAVAARTVLDMRI